MMSAALLFFACGLAAAIAVCDLDTAIHRDAAQLQTEGCAALVRALVDGGEWRC